jgi:two-component system, chemotaxis family, CheB/CheR fusion protein
MSPEEASSATPDHKRDDAPVMHVVGIGASSGGLDALQTLFKSMPPNPGFACVVVVHLSPEHESHLPELLQQCTAMRVQQVSVTVPLQRNHVYVIPPNANLESVDTHLRLSKLEERRIARAPIDHFLHTLAKTHDGTAIAVILTGAGTDGTIGLRHIKQCGGLTIAQDPDEAEFDSMPRSAIATSMVDWVLPIEDMADYISRFCATQPQLPSADATDAGNRSDEDLYLQLIEELQRRTQHDFSVYRKPVLLGRLRRRMQLHFVTTFSAYLQILEREEREASNLLNDLLLVPTEFFRDARIFEALEQRIVPEIFARKAGEGGHVRVWSIGCSSGEEAYSLAILLLEERARRDMSQRLQVFASDLSEKLLWTARQGIYPREIATSVSPQRLASYFIASQGFFRVKNELKDTVLFTTHNLFKDPPFGHVDLLMCRTLLSDLQPAIRHGVLSVFHYALEKRGVLVVGADDTVDAPDLFQPQAGLTGVFQKVGHAEHLAKLPNSLQPFGPEGMRGALRTQLAHRVGMDTIEPDIANVHRSAADLYAPPSVLIDSDHNVVHFSSHAAKYLTFPGGKLTYDLTQLVHEPLRFRLLEALHKVRTESPKWTCGAIWAAPGHNPVHLTLRLERVATTDLILVVFDDQRSSAQRERASGLAPLEYELTLLRKRLQQFLQPTAGADDAATIERQRAAHELNAVIDALAASKEELQATHEELIALDAENHRRIRELTQVSTDLQHLLASTGIATLFLDRNLNIIRFTPLVGELFELRPTDIGRPIQDLARLASHEHLADDARRSLHTLATVERELAIGQRRWYLRRILPYRASSGNIEGVVLTLIDITERKKAEEALRQANRNKDEFLAVLAHELRNPLAPIISGVEVLKSAPTNQGMVERVAGTISRQTGQLVRLVDDLLEVSRINGGKLRLRISVVDLREVVHDAVSGATVAVERAGHQLCVTLPSNELPVEGDQARLVQVLSNLLNNAVRYSANPGTITLNVSRDDSNAVLCLRDQGVGIAPEALPHVFDMFYQGPNARAAVAGGLGIGLTLAKNLIEMHGGAIAVTSEGANRGSEFTIRLPLALDKQVASRVEEEPTALGDHRILIVDDNVDAAETLCLQLQAMGGQEVHTASSGSQALEAMPLLQPDIVLLDLMMPEMDGYEVARQVRKASLLNQPMLVALSGLGHEEHRKRSKEAGFDRHLTKPADLASLRKMLQEHRATP